MTDLNMKWSANWGDEGFREPSSAFFQSIQAGFGDVTIPR